MFYGLRLLSATRAFRVDCRVKTIGVSLEEGGVTSSYTGEENGVASRGDSPTVDWSRKLLGVDLLSSAVARQWVIYSSVVECTGCGEGD